jgi:predicted transport protein
LLNKISILPNIQHYPTDSKDYRLKKQYVFCELQPKKQHINILLRVDSFNINSDLFPLKDVSSGKPGEKWVKFEITDENQLNEAISLITKVFNFV